MVCSIFSKKFVDLVRLFIGIWLSLTWFFQNCVPFVEVKGFMDMDCI